MKIPPARADRFAAAPGEDMIAVLLYGPDTGLVRERAEAATRAVAGTLNDPFLVAEIGPAELREDPARLMDEARALSLGGGRRAVRLRGATDALAATLAEVIAALGEGPPAPSLMIVEAGELGPRSKLRKLCEAHDRAAAVACYLDEGEGLERIIAAMLKDQGLRAGADALAWLGQHLGADRRVTRSEIDKLALYCAGRAEVTLEDCLAVIGDGAINDLDQAVFAAAGGDLAGLDAALMRAFREGVSPVTVLRAALRHLQRLHLVSGAMAGGASVEAAMKGLRPPVFFKLADRFRAQARSWPADQLATALTLLNEAELACKSTGQPDTLICARSLMQVAAAGRRARRGP